MKRALLPGAFAAALAVALIVAWIVVRSRDAAAVVPSATTAELGEAEPSIELAAPKQPSAASESGERVESRAQDSTPPLNRWGLGDGGPLAHFRGRLVYESTGQGVPWCVVGLRGVGRQVEFCTTDDEGRFHSRLAYPLARTLVLVNGDGTQSVEWERALEVHREDGEAEQTLKVQVAPTLVLPGELPTGLDPSKLTGSIASHDDRPYVFLSVRAGGEHWFARGALPEAPDFERERTRIAEYRAKLQTELTNLDGSKLSPQAQRLFEQWRAEHSNDGVESVDAKAKRIVDEASNMGPPWKMRLVSEHETWTGTAVLQQLDGVIEVTPHWDSLGDVAITFHGNWTTPPTWSILAELRFESTDPRSTNDSGTLQNPLHFFGLAAGPYVLSLRCDMCDELEFPVLVRAAETTEVDVQLNCATSAGSIHGEVTSESGEEPKEPLSLNLWRPGLVSFGDIKLVRDTSSEHWRATFEIADVPEGEFNLTCFAGDFGTEPAAAVSARAGDFVRLRVLDRPTYVDIGFRVFDAESGAQLDTFDVNLNRNGNESQLRGLKSGSIVVEHLPESGRLWWNVTSPGHVCAEGNVAEQSGWGLSTGTKRWIDVRLQRGWRIKCAVFDDDYGTLTGATIVADGVDIGTTDIDGYFTLTLPQRPKLIEAHYRDWRCIESDTAGLATMESCDEVGFVFERKR